MIWRKHYRSMYEGSMIGAGAAVFALMGYVISHQEYERGLGCWVVRLNPALLSAVMGEKVDVIQKAIDYLCAPDKNSGSPLEEGRRLVGLGERSMEYRVVNGEKYQEMRDYEERKVQNREAQAKWRAMRKAGSNGGSAPQVTGPTVEPAPLPSGQSIEGFEQFWAAYPKKVARFDAERVFVEFHAKDRMPEILAALEWQVKSADWKKEQGQYIPTPANYLRDGRWNDVKPRPVRNGPNI